MGRWKKSNRQKSKIPASRRPKSWPSRLHLLTLEDRTVPSNFTSTNSGVILIPGNQSENPGKGSASPDPSTITASGLTGVVSHLTVTLNDLEHESGDDVQVLLRAPDGTNIFLMANNGGPDNPVSASPVFDSSATGTIGSNGIGNGPYAPLNNGSVTPSHLPAGTPAPVTTMGLGGFYGISPNGTWGLYIDDVNALDVGQMIGGWTLSIDYRANTAPVANNDTYSTNENTTLNVSTAATGVLHNDTDANGDPLTAHLVTGPANGSVTLNGDGTFSYVPNRYFSGTDTFTYKDDDGIVYGNTATVTINVTQVVQPPQAYPDSYTLQNGGPQYVAAAFGVLANDVDTGGAIPNYSYYSENFTELPLQAFPPGIHGGANSTHTDWSPNLPAGWTRDNSPTSNSANQTPPYPTLPPTTPTPPPPPPAAGQMYNPAEPYYGWHVLNIDSWIGEQGDQDRSKFLNEANFPGFNQPTGNYTNTGSHTPVLVADGDAYDDYVSIAAPHRMNTYAYLPAIKLNGALDGTLKLSFDQSFRPEDPSDGYQDATVDVSFDGGATWTNLLTQDNVDPNNPSGPLLKAGDESRINQHVTLSVNNPTGPPTATALFRFGYLDGGNDWWWAIDNINVTADRTDASILTANLVTPPSHGTLNFNANGSFTYTANPLGYTGPDSFTYTATAGSFTTAPTTVSIQVNQNTTAPVPVNDAFRTTQDHVLTVTAPFGLLVNDADPDTGGYVGLTAAEVSPPSNGTLTFNIDGSFTFTPNAGFSGTTSFTYADSDGVYTSSAATVTITVLPLSPVANNDTYRVNENSVLTTTAATGVQANDHDPNSLPMTSTVATMPTHGALTLNSDGSFTYTPTTGYFGPDSFTYNDSNGTYTSTTPGTVSITVVPPAPVANTDTYLVNENGTLTTTAANGVLANDSDPNSLPFTAILVGTGAAHGTLTFNSDGSFVYVPNQNYNGPDSFRYQAYESTFTVGSIATVNITVKYVAGPPIANPDFYATANTMALTTTAANGVLANDQNNGHGVTLISENLSETTLQPFPTGTHGQNGGVTNNPLGDWTDSLPAGWVRDNAPSGHSPTPAPDPTQPAAEDYYGWHVFDIDSWIHEQGNQSRNVFLNEQNYGGYSQLTSPTGLVGSHTPVFVADGDAYFDYNHTTPGGLMSTYLYTPDISLGAANQNSLTLDFDSSFRPESGTQTGTVEVSYDGGTTWANLLTYNNATTGNNVGTLAYANKHVTLNAANPAGATDAMFRFGYLDASNEWWWAIANVNVTAQKLVAGENPSVTAAVATPPSHGMLSLSPNGAFTYTPTPGYSGPDSFTYTASNSTATSAPATVSLQVAPSSVGVQVNDGSVQRSEVRSMTITFAGVATFTGDPVTAFQLAGPNGNVTLAASTPTTTNGETSVTLTFSGSATDPISAMNGRAPSLADGRYQLTVFSADVKVNGATLDGDNNGSAGGDFVSPTDTFGGNGLKLYRLYGDVTGDGVVDPTDLNFFRTTFNVNNTQANFIAVLDANNDGVVDPVDLNQFRPRFNTNVF
jgi:hypothetical protein